MAAQNDLIVVAIEKKGQSHSLLSVLVFINLENPQVNQPGSTTYCASLSGNNFWRQWGRKLLGNGEEPTQQWEKAY